MVSSETGTYKICPPREIFGFESYTARGLISLARAVLEGRLEYSPRLAERIYTCLLCGNCRTHCELLQVDTVSIIRALRQEVVRAGLELDALKQVDANVKKEHNVFGMPSQHITKWAEELKLPQEGNILYFSGCYAYRYPQTAKATISILREAGLDIAYLGEGEWCCGAPEFANGSIVLAEELAVHNVEAIKTSNAKKVITSCAGCYHTLKSEYPELIGKLPFEVDHVSEVIVELIEKNKIKLDKEINKRVTYHDPCHLGRCEEVYEAPRKILKSIKGISFFEMLRNKENAWCCGGGTTTYTAFPQITARIAKTRIKEAENVGVEAIVTACALCLTVLTPPAKKTGIEVYDLPVIVAEAMDLKL